MIETSYIIISSLLSGIVGVIISIYYHRRHERRAQQFEVLRRVARYRFALTENITSPEVKSQFFGALNEVFVVFYKHPDVLDALNQLHRDLRDPDKFPNNFVTLYKAMCKALNINTNALNDEFFLRPFSSTEL